MTQRFTTRQHAKSGFTLIELLVVIAIIALLAAILFPVFAQAREKARQTTCTSNLRQIGIAVRMYVQDFDETFPIFQAYNTAASGGAPGTPGHKGVEDEVMQYVKNRALFTCPDDLGGPTTNSLTYQQTYGSSYRFTAACYTVVGGVSGSYEDDAQAGQPVGSHPVVTVTDSMFQYPADTRIMRDEMFPWFSAISDPTGSKYGYIPGYYTQWHSGGGGIVYADGHAKFCVSELAFKAIDATPAGLSYNTGCWYGCE